MALLKDLIISKLEEKDPELMGILIYGFIQYYPAGLMRKNAEEKSLDHHLRCAFIWSNTSEDHKYWHDIEQKLILIEESSILG